MDTNNNLPPLKVAAGKKTREWAIEVADFADNNVSMYHSGDTRADITEAMINLDLYDGILHVSDLVTLMNPLDLKTIDSTREIRHYPIAAPVLDLLVGEEIKAPFEPLLRVTNNIAIEEKEERKKAHIAQFIASISETFEGTEEELQAKVAKFHRFTKYSYKDIKEKKAMALYTQYWEELDIEAKLVEGYRLAFNTGEEIYDIDVIHNEPTFNVLSATQVKHWGLNMSTKIEDADIITIENHFSSGSLIDTYGSQLSTSEIDQILSLNVGARGSLDKTYGDVTYEFDPGYIGAEPLSNNFIDRYDNIRTLNIRFKAYKQVKKILYQDEATGEQQIKTVDEKYKINVTAGEKLKSKEWISEWWKVVKIGNDIYTDITRLPFSYNRISQPGEGHPGIVGEVYSLPGRKAVPAMSRMKPYQYLYDIIIDRMIVAMSKNVGPILEMGFERKPDSWGTEKWLKYMYKYNTKFVDNFKEVNKGSAQGQLAGNLSSGRDQQLSLDFGNYIQQLVNMAEYVKAATGDIIGITPQRKGAIQNRETVGGVERATSQSSHVTEWYRYKHEQVKLRALNVFLEAAKSALKDNPKKLNTMVEASLASVLEVTEDDFVGVDIGIFVTNANKVKEHKNILEQSAQAYMQNGGSFSFVFDVLFSDSMSDRRRLIEEHESEMQQNQAEAGKQEQAAVQAEMQQRTEKEELDRAAAKYKVDLDAKVKLKLKQADVLIAQGKLKADGDRGVAELEKSILALQAEMDDSMKERNLKRELAETKSKDTPTG